MSLAEDLAPDVVVREDGPAVWALCRRLAPDPEDAYQDVWSHVLPRLDRHDPARGSRRTFVLTLAHRRLVDRHRRRVVRRTEPLDGELADSTGAPDTLVHLRRRRDRLERALAQLSEAQRRVIVGHHLSGLSLQDLAESEGVAVGTIKSRLHRARGRLATLLGRSP